jgi:6-phosphogluconolactonase
MCITVHRGTRHVFATNATSVAVFDVDPISGKLTAVENSPFATSGTAAYGVVANQDGTRIFVANYSSNDVSVFDVAADGELTAVNGSPFNAPDGGGVDTPQLMHGEELLAVTDEGEQLFVYKVNESTGALTLVEGSPFDTGADEWSSRADPSGTWLFVPDSNADTILVYEFDDTTGVPSEIDDSPFATGATSGQPMGFAFSPDGSYLFSGNYNYNELYVYSLTDGVPTAIDDSPFAIADVNEATSLAVTRDGKFLVVTHEGEDYLSVFEIDVDGSLTPVSGSPFSFNLGSASGVAIGE